MKRVSLGLLALALAMAARPADAAVIVIDSFCSGAQTATFDQPGELYRNEVAAGPTATCGGAIGGYRVVDAIGNGSPVTPATIGIADAANPGRAGITLEGSSTISPLYIGWDGRNDGGLGAGALNLDLTQAGLDPYFELAYLTNVAVNLNVAIESNGAYRTKSIQLNPFDSGVARIGLAEFATLGANLSAVQSIYLLVGNLTNNVSAPQAFLDIRDFVVFGTDPPPPPPPTPAPEPASLALLATAGLCGMLRRARR